MLVYVLLSGVFPLDSSPLRRVGWGRIEGRVGRRVGVRVGLGGVGWGGTYDQSTGEG